LRAYGRPSRIDLKPAHVRRPPLRVVAAAAPVLGGFRYRASDPSATASRLNVTGKSYRTTFFSVEREFVHLGLPATGILSFGSPGRPRR